MVGLSLGRMVEDMSDFEDKYRRWHTRISFFKSGIRLFACFACVVTGDVIILAAGLGLAEILGIAEEIM